MDGKGFVMQAAGILQRVTGRRFPDLEKALLEAPQDAQAAFLRMAREVEQSHDSTVRRSRMGLALGCLGR